MTYQWLLSLLLYMDFGGNQLYSFRTENCFSTKSDSRLVRFNRVYHVNTFSDSEVVNIKDQFGAIPFSWIIETHDHNAASMLERHGFTKYPDMFYGMKANIENIVDDTYAPHIIIKEINEQHDIEKLIDIILLSNSIYEKDELIKAIDDLRLKAAQSIKLYLGFYEQEPCATSIVIYHENAVTFHMVSTLPEYRCKGLGYAITHKGLLDASYDGITKAYLMSSIMAQSLYRKIGFEEYAQYYIYIYKPY